MGFHIWRTPPRLCPFIGGTSDVSESCSTFIGLCRVGSQPVRTRAPAVEASAPRHLHTHPCSPSNSLTPAVVLVPDVCREPVCHISLYVFIFRIYTTWMKTMMLQLPFLANRRNWQPQAAFSTTWWAFYVFPILAMCVWSGGWERAFQFRNISSFGHKIFRTGTNSTPHL